MTIQDLKKWQTSQELEDVWWIQIDGETLGRKVNLEKIGQILNQKLDSKVMVLHVSRTSQRPRPWIDVERAQTARSRVEVERAKTVFVDKPHDHGLDGKETNAVYSGEREPRPAPDVNFYPIQGNPVQTPVSDASFPSPLPPPPASPAQSKKKPKKGGVGGLLTTIMIFGLITILGRTCGSKVGGDLARKHAAQPDSLITFQSEMNEVEMLLGRYQNSVNTPLKALKTLSALEKGMSQIKTAGLPNELASSFIQFRNTMREFLNHLKNTPFPPELISEGPQGISRWVQKQDVSNPGFKEIYKRKMDVWEKEAASYQVKIPNVTFRLSEAMQRHNIDFDFSVGTK